MRILYIDIDSLRPDHLGCYGYPRSTSPTIDALAAAGVRFDQCYASDLPCMPSRTSLFSGMLGIRHGCVSHTGTRAEPFAEGLDRSFYPRWGRQSWMRQLQEAGLKTVTFSSFAERHGAWHWYAGFREIHETGHFGHDHAEDVVLQVDTWLRRQGRAENWFCHLNLWDVHIPYRTPQTLGNLFADEPIVHDWLTQELLDDHRERSGIRSAQDAIFLRYAQKRPDLNPAALQTLADVKLMHDAYDTAICHVDQQLSILLDTLEELGLREETAIIISADHGECLGELNAYGGHCFADHCTAHVPLIIHWPGVSDALPGHSEGALHYHLDLAPTVCELLGAPVPEAWDACSFAPALRGKESGGRRELVCSQLAQTCQRSLIRREQGGLQLYLRTYRDGYYDFSEEQLFDIQNDPHQCQDLALSRPESLSKARDRLSTWEQEHRIEACGDPLDAVLSDPPEVRAEDYRQRLIDTKRTSCAQKLCS